MIKKKCPHCSHVNEFGLFSIQICQLCGRVIPRSRIPILIAVILILVGLGAVFYFQRTAITEFFEKPQGQDTELEKTLGIALKQHPVNRVMTKEELERQEEIIVRFKKYESKGLTAYRQGKHELALDFFRTAVTIFEAAQMDGIITKDNSLLSPQVISRLFVRAAESAQHLERDEESAFYAEIALSVDASIANKGLLISAYVNAGDHSKALSLIEEELENDPGSEFWREQKAFIKKVIAMKENRERAKRKN